MRELIHTKSNTNYGVFTEISKGANLVLGDQTGRTVSLRTGQGFKRVNNLETLHENEAVDIVHGLMIISVIGYKADPKILKAIGALALIAFLYLVYCYLAGERKPQYVRK